MILPRSVRAMTSNWARSLFMDVVIILCFQNIEVLAYPLDRFIEPLVQRNPIAPTKFFSHFCSVEMIGAVLAQTLAHYFDMIFERDIELLANSFDKFPNRNHFRGRNMVGIPVASTEHNPPGGIGHIFHVDEIASGSPAAMQLDFTPEKDK